MTNTLKAHNYACLATVFKYFLVNDIGQLMVLAFLGRFYTIYVTGGCATNLNPNPSITLKI